MELSINDVTLNITNGVKAKKISDKNARAWISTFFPPNECFYPRKSKQSKFLELFVSGLRLDWQGIFRRQMAPTLSILSWVKTFYLSWKRLRSIPVNFIPYFLSYSWCVRYNYFPDIGHSDLRCLITLVNSKMVKFQIFNSFLL